MKSGAVTCHRLGRAVAINSGETARSRQAEMRIADFELLVHPCECTNVRKTVEASDVRIGIRPDLGHLVSVNARPANHVAFRGSSTLLHRQPPPRSAPTRIPVFRTFLWRIARRCTCRCQTPARLHFKVRRSHLDWPLLGIHLIASCTKLPLATVFSLFYKAPLSPKARVLFFLPWLLLLPVCCPTTLSLFTLPLPLPLRLHAPTLV